ncbi:MAG: trimethylamine methyltransferase family protein [Candidatus Koribacter versatilis]|nr:trimethylamine methyltransferase family protein [Candidatus Koribacter versatilis]
MTPKLQLLDSATVEKVLAEAFELIQSPGVKVAPVAAELLSAAGVLVADGIAHIPEAVVRRALASAPKEFSLYTRDGQAPVHYGGDDVHFDPGSSCLNILDAESCQPRLAKAADLARLAQLTELLPEYAAQSTAMVCSDVPQDIGDFYRLLIVLWYSNKPVVTGAFSGPTLQAMLDLLATDAGGADRLRQKPRAVFDVCPSPPLNWSDFASENIVQLARAGVPAEIVSMPLAGATAPVTLIGSVVQHAAECLSGLTIHQLAGSGAPIVWGGAPAIFDMSSAGTPMGAIETVMLNIACTQVGKHLGLPTHGYMVATESKVVDAQAGMESATSAALGALAGINMISGAGMLDSLACHSLEKLVIDAEAIASAQRLRRGLETSFPSFATQMFAQIGLSGDFLKLKETRALFRSEQHFPSSVTHRGEIPEGTVAEDTFSRARARVGELMGSYLRPAISPQTENNLIEVALRVARSVGLSELPGIEPARASEGNVLSQR